MVFWLVLLAILIPFILFLSSLRRCLILIHEQNREMSPGLVWLNLIPLFGQGWLVYTVVKISHSVKKQAEARNTVELGDGAYSVGLAMAICGIVSVIPFVGLITGLACLVLWIIYWIKIAQLNSKLEGLALKGFQYCPHCGFRLNTGTTFCGGCGTSLTGTTQQDSPE